MAKLSPYTAVLPDMFWVPALKLMGVRKEFQFSSSAVFLLTFVHHELLDGSRLFFAVQVAQLEVAGNDAEGDSRRVVVKLAAVSSSDDSPCSRAFWSRAVGGTSSGLYWCGGGCAHGPTVLCFNYGIFFVICRTGM